MRIPLPSRILYVILGLFMPIGAHLADFNETHIFNADWPPHAKFHTGQTLGFSIVLGLATLFFACRKTQDRFTAVLTTSLFAGVYWITQLAAILYPGTDFIDPKFDNPPQFVLGMRPQVPLDIVMMALIALAATLALRKRDWT